jgi:hypothetical protein
MLCVKIFIALEANEVHQQEVSLANQVHRRNVQHPLRKDQPSPALVQAEPQASVLRANRALVEHEVVCAPATMKVAYEFPNA